MKRAWRFEQQFSSSQHREEKRPVAEGIKQATRDNEYYLKGTGG